MCLAIYRPEGAAAIPNAYLDLGMARNPDGFGLAWVADGRVMTAKYAPHDKTAFRKRYREVEATGQPVVAHLTVATHGASTAANAHPFTYEDVAEGTVAVVHNGILPIRTEAGASDSETFVRQVLTRLPCAWWRNPALMYLVSEAIGPGNKLVLMTATETVIVNERSGTWDAEVGAWFSSTYKPSYVPWTPSTGRAPSKREQRRQRAKARRDGPLVPALATVTGEEAYVPDPGMRGGGYPNLRHNGHAMTATTPINREKDGTYLLGAICDDCKTFADVYVIEGTVYMDGSHHVAVSA